MKHPKSIAGFSVPELLIVLLILGAVFGVGGYAWTKVSSRSKATSTKTAIVKSDALDSQQQTSAADLDKGWAEYRSNEYGFTFRYPQEWGTVTVTRKALNDERYETNLPYVVGFQNSEAPKARIFPADWKFNPPFATEWDRPLTYDPLLDKRNALQVSLDQTKVASIVFSSIGGGIRLLGLKSEVISKLNAKEVEFMQGDSYSEGGKLAPKTSCLTQKTDGSMEGYPTLDCYPEAYRNTFVKFMDSFKAI